MTNTVEPSAKTECPVGDRGFTADPCKLESRANEVLAAEADGGEGAIPPESREQALVTATGLCVRGQPGA